MKILDSISHIYNIELLASLLPMSGKQCYIHCFIMIKIIVQKDAEWSGIWENRESENVINLFCTLYEYYFYFVFFREVESVERYLKCKRFYHNMGLTIATQRN